MKVVGSLQADDRRTTHVARTLHYRLHELLCLGPEAPYMTVRCSLFSFIYMNIYIYRLYYANTRTRG